MLDLPERFIWLYYHPHNLKTKVLIYIPIGSSCQSVSIVFLKDHILNILNILFNAIPILPEHYDCLPHLFRWDYLHFSAVYQPRDINKRRVRLPQKCIDFLVLIYVVHSLGILEVKPVFTLDLITDLVDEISGCGHDRCVDNDARKLGGWQEEGNIDLGSIFGRFWMWEVDIVVVERGWWALWVPVHV